MEVTIECYEPSISEELAKQGFQMTFGDVNRDTPIVMVEDGKGKWFLFAIVNGAFCQLASGLGGYYAVLP